MTFFFTTNELWMEIINCVIEHDTGWYTFMLKLLKGFLSNVLIFTIFSVLLTDTDRRSQNLLYLYSGMGLILGVFGFFPRSKKKILVSSGAYVLRSEREDIHAWNAWRGTKIVDAFCLRLFPRVWLAETRIPRMRATWLTMGGCVIQSQTHHYTERYRSSRSSFLYLWYYFKLAVDLFIQRCENFGIFIAWTMAKRLRICVARSIHNHANATRVAQHNAQYAKLLARRG